MSWMPGYAATYSTAGPVFSGRAGRPGRQQVQIADSFPSPAQRAGRRHLLNSFELKQIGGDPLGFFFGHVDTESPALRR